MHSFIIHKFTENLLLYAINLYHDYFSFLDPMGCVDPLRDFMGRKNRLLYYVVQPLLHEVKLRHKHQIKQT